MPRSGFAVARCGGTTAKSGTCSARTLTNRQSNDDEIVTTTRAGPARKGGESSQGPRRTMRPLVPFSARRTLVVAAPPPHEGAMMPRTGSPIAASGRWETGYWRSLKGAADCGPAAGGVVVHCAVGDVLRAIEVGRDWATRSRRGEASVWRSARRTAMRRPIACERLKSAVWRSARRTVLTRSVLASERLKSAARPRSEG
jgi:hypothetical protein